MYEVIVNLHMHTRYSDRSGIHADIARAVHNGIAERVASMVRRVGIEKALVLVGGVARNMGFVDALNRILGVEVKIPEDPEYVSALGAALSHN